MDCIFCKIARKEIPAEIVYEDEFFIAFLDINPRSRGMTIVAPKSHIKSLEELPKEIFEVVVKISIAIQKALSPEAIGISLMPSQIEHLHLRIYPYFKDEIPLIENTPIKISKEEFSEIGNKIRENILKSVILKEEKKEEKVKEEKKEERKRSEEEIFWMKRDWLIA